MRIEHRHECASLLTLVHDAQNVARVAAKAIQACYNQFVSMAKEF
ncbi:hypothetical protein ShzoTeo12_28980 [Shinella zoogloeoides]|nr:hypothetical protein ShzoTeo12_28980 [Shinella zoogloeoides]